MTIRIRVLALAGLALAAAAALLPATLAQARAPKSFFGIVPQTNLTQDDFDRMEQGKLGTLRIPFAWQVLQPSEAGAIDWSSVDPLVAGAASAGMTVEPFLSGSPDWVARLDGHSCRGLGCVPLAPTGQQALSAWSNFVSEAVARYGRSGTFWTENPTVPKHPITVWQIWNEQNSKAFFAPKPKPKSYAALLAAAADAIRSQDPSADIVLGGMAGLEGSKKATPAWDYLEKLYKVRGAKSDFDGVAAHPYGAKLKAVSEQIDEFRKVMKKAHDSKAGMYITEIGWGSRTGGNPLNVGKQGQANQLKDAYKYFVKRRKKLRIQTVDWFSWMDSSQSICSWCASSGLFKSGLKAKPSWKALVKFTGGS